MTNPLQPESRSSIFQQQYTEEFVDRWDELIDWESRRKSEDGFFQKLLLEHNVHRVLDIACGTGYHTITLGQSGFDVTGADGSAKMVAKSVENARRSGLEGIPFLEAEWSNLEEAFPCGTQFDAIICLGNALTHLFEEAERAHLLNQVYKLLKPGCIAVIDQRNYDAMLDQGFSSKHAYYYLGSTVYVHPTSITPEAVEITYDYADGETHHLTVFPLRQEHLTRLIREAGFWEVTLFGDFNPRYDKYGPDFIVQVARKPGQGDEPE